MSRILVFSDQFPDDLSSGRYLRVNHLCRALAASNDCFLVYMSGDERESGEISALGCKDSHCFPQRPMVSKSLRRHFRLSNERFLELSSPAYVDEVVSGIGRLIEKWQIDLIVNFSPERAELLLDQRLPKLLDYTDCDTLTLERVLAQRGSEMHLSERIAMQLQLLRQKRMEQSVLSAYDMTTTIAEPDRHRMLQLSGISEDRVVVVPNGVSEEALDMGSRVTQHDRSVVFWGNLNFAPNWTAVRYFYESIFLPYLAERGITWHVFGGGAGPELEEVFSHPQIRAEGFTENLFDHVIRSGVMVNPMVEGSGLKNKVLEAFALGLPVVSTCLGVEGIDIQPDVHCVVSDDPEEFAAGVNKILDSEELAKTIAQAARARVIDRYSWERAGALLLDVVGRLGKHGN